MKRIFFYVFTFCISYGLLSQNEMEDRYYFHSNIDKGDLLTVSQNEDGTLKVVSRENNLETNIYSEYKVFELQKAFPNTKDSLLKTVYNIVTNRVELLGSLQYNFPKKYTRIDQYYPNEGPYYPNDYGATSPVKNLGTTSALYDLDLIKAPQAWGITKGSKKVVIGISDARIDSMHQDFGGRISNYIKYSNSSNGLTCAHGSNVAGIAVARMDNAVGRPGICAECDVVATSYGSFKQIEELVEAGAKVINTSWVLCHMGTYHENIEARINEFYDDGIIIVAAAGNTNDCKRNGVVLHDNGYPASFEKVISVTGVFSEFSAPSENIFIGKEGTEATAYLKDRHAREFSVDKDQNITAKYVQWVMRYNPSIDISAPARTYLIGHELCGYDFVVGGATSAAAPYITGVLGLIWSVNYCLSSYEAESILKLSSEDIEVLPGNERFIGGLGSGRVDAYRAVKMARETKALFGNLEIENRDFYRFNFKIENAPYNITLRNQTFRDSSTVDFKARNSIVLKPNTALRPDKLGFMKLSIDPDIPTEECFPKPPKQYVDIYKKRDTSDSLESDIKFEVAYKKEEKAIYIRPLINDKKSNENYFVQVLNSSNKIIKSEQFKYPEAGSIKLNIPSGQVIVVKISFRHKNENHSLKI